MNFKRNPTGFYLILNAATSIVTDNSPLSSWHKSQESPNQLDLGCLSEE